MMLLKALAQVAATVARSLGYHDLARRLVPPPESKPDEACPGGV